MLYHWATQEHGVPQEQEHNIYSKHTEIHNLAWNLNLLSFVNAHYWSHFEQLVVPVVSFIYLFIYLFVIFFISF